MSDTQLIIHIKSFDKKLLEKNIRLLVSLFDFNSSFIQSSNFSKSLSFQVVDKSQIGRFDLPIKRTKFTVLRSPHIDKKSREQFEMRIFHTLLFFQHKFLSSQHEIANFFTTLKNMEFVGVQIECKWNYQTYYAKRGT